MPEPELPRLPDSPASGQEESLGFQMSGRRAVLEIALVVGIAGAAILGVVAFARYGAERFIGAVPISVDRTMGEQAARLISLTSSPCTDRAPLKYVETVAAPLLASIDDSRFAFSFVVVDDAEVNAFALPGGFVTVNRGLLDAAESGDEVAAVLAHEIQHVLRRHGTVRMLRELGASAVLGVLFGGTDIAVPARVTHNFMSNAYDRAEESEADERGLGLMRKAGLDPRGMARFFERLSKTALTPPALLSTHPDPGDRAEKAARAAAGAKVKTVLPPPPKAMKCR